MDDHYSLELASSALQVFSAVMVFVFGLIGALFLRRWFNCSSGRALLLYLWHTLFCLVHLAYVKVISGDPLMYFVYVRKEMVADEWMRNFTGTLFIKHLTQFLRMDLGLSLLGIFLVFNIVGFVGLIAFDASLRKVLAFSSRTAKRFATVVVFLPSISFWTASINKDAISFMAIGLMVWGALEPRRRGALILFSVLLMGIVRVHISAIMMVALCGALILGSGNMRFIKRMFIVLMLLQPLVFALNSVIELPEVKGAGKDILVDPASALQEAIEVRQGYNVHGGSSIDIRNMSVPVQVFTYMFRPLFFDAHNTAALIASIDNLILLAFFVYASKSLLGKKFSGPMYLYLWMYAIICVLVLAATTANLGINVRQKWMVMPVFIFLFSAGMRPAVLRGKRIAL
jgi:hypothetical protein